MRGEPSSPEDVSDGGRLHQLLILAGLGLFVTGLILTGFLSGVGVPLSFLDGSDGPSVDDAISGAPSDVPADDDDGEEEEPPDDAGADGDDEEADDAADAEPDDDRDDEGADDGADDTADDAADDEPDEQAEFAVTELNVPDNATAGEEVEVEFRIENVGDAEGEVTTTLMFEDEVIAEDQITLEPGESAIGHYWIDTEGYDEGQYWVTVDVGDDEAREQIRLEEEENDGADDNEADDDDAGDDDDDDDPGDDDDADDDDDGDDDADDDDDGILP